MVDALLQIAELELSPVVTRPGGAQAVNGRIRIQAAEPADAHLRRLPQRTSQGWRVGCLHRAPDDARKP